MKHLKWLITPIIALVALIIAYEPGHACGGLFCQNSPVDQNAERIIFTQNDDGTITTLVEIQYTGSAPDFSWILPIPVPIGEDDLAVPETGVAALDELETITAPVIIPPPIPECANIMFEAVPEEAMADGVEVFASGEVGPFSYDVIGSEDPRALIAWLRDNEYRVTQEMEPLINVYVEEEFAFIAMQLLPDETVDSIKPIEITYPAETPMIPLRLTAVAANPDMRILTWVFAEEQAVPTNYAHFEIPNEDITFFTFGGNNYRQIIGEYADRTNGQGFITEYAAPTTELAATDPLLVEYASNHSYVTRLSTVISPEEMTVDPEFGYDPQRSNVSNVRDLSQMSGLYDCEKEPIPQEIEQIEPPSASGEVSINPVDTTERDDAIVVEQSNDAPSQGLIAAVIGFGGLVIIGSIAFIANALSSNKQA